MKILWILPQIGAAVPSFHAISVLSAVIRQTGHQSALLEMPRMRLQTVDEAIHRHDPAVVAITSVTQQIPYTKQIIAHVKQRFPQIQTVLGGTHSIVRPSVIEEIPELDALATNESEGPILEYLACLEAGRPPIEVPNFRVRVDGEVCTSSRTYTCTEEEMTSMPFEDRELFPRWRDTPKQIPLESLGIRPRFWFSRGCPYSCTYCAVPALRKLYPLKQFVRYPSVERVIAELEYVADRWDWQTAIFDDDVFTTRRDWILDWAAKYPSKLKQKGYEVCMRIETAHDDVLRALKDTNCTLLKFGLESGDYRLRKEVLKRNITDERTIEVFERCRQLGLKAHTFCMVGFPDETRRQAWKTIRLNQRLKPDRTQISIFYPYAGTELGEASMAMGIVEGHGDNYFDRSVLTLTHLYKWEVKLYGRMFRFLVYLAYSPRLAWQEVVAIFKRSVRDRLLKRTKERRYDLENYRQTLSEPGLRDLRTQAETEKVQGP